MRFFNMLIAKLILLSLFATLYAKDYTIELKNQKSTINQKLAISEIEKLNSVEYKLVDPYSKKEVVYKGVLVKDFLKNFSKNATGLNLKAYDNYKVTISKELISSYDMMLAYSANGKMLELRDGGPLKVVFPYHKHQDIDKNKINAYWIWMIKEIEFIK
ncbi:MAG: molybdopterin-dependent oxidoreductase [Campylobacterales bacterium]|nr:molybdopterin-dependent oxidoreductase [Campylobacterales bacterium]